MVEYIQYQQPFIKYPNRFAKQLRESPYLTQLDGEGYMEMQHQQEQEIKEKDKELEIRRLASENKETRLFCGQKAILNQHPLLTRRLADTGYRRKRQLKNKETRSRW